METLCIPPDRGQNWDERDRSHVQKKGPEMFSVPVPFRNIGWFAIAPSTKGCGELLARVSEDSKENYLCLTGGSILCSLGRTLTKINGRLGQQLHVINVRNQEADFLQLVVLHEISKILYHQKA